MMAWASAINASASVSLSAPVRRLASTWRINAISKFIPARSLPRAIAAWAATMAATVAIVWVCSAAYRRINDLKDV